jgi:hypothetical protein
MCRIAEPPLCERIGAQQIAEFIVHLGDGYTPEERQCRARAKRQQSDQYNGKPLSLDDEVNPALL